MPHNKRLFPSTQWSGLIVPTPSILRRLDQSAAESIDGDNGGSWTPSSPIVVGGAGVRIQDAGVFSGGLTTGARAKDGGAIVYPPGSSPGFISSSRTRALEMPLRNLYTRRDELSIYDTSRQWYDETTPAALAEGRTTGSTLSYFVAVVPPRFIHATGILSLSLRMRVGLRASSVPLNMPGFRILRIPATGLYGASDDGYVIPTRANATAYGLGDLVIPTAPNGRQFRCSTAGTSSGAQPAAFTTASVGQTVADGGSLVWTCETGPTSATGHYFTLPRPATMSDYFASGQAQDIVMTPLRAGFFSTPDAYTFVIDILDGSQTANIFHAVKFTYSAITSYAPPV